MKEKIWICLISMTLAVFSGPLAMAAEVAQGKCIEYDKEKALVAIEEYDIQFSKEYPYGQPTGARSVFDVSRAQIGLMPEPGDILRIAYRTEGAGRVALRVMNVSKQDLMRK